MEDNKNAYDIVQKFLDKKKEKSNDAERLAAIETFLKRDLCFFEISAENALKLLTYLEIPNEDLLDIYKKLISPESYLLRRKKIRTMIPNSFESDRTK